MRKLIRFALPVFFIVVIGLVVWVSFTSRGTRISGQTGEVLEADGQAGSLQELTPVAVEAIPESDPEEKALQAGGLGVVDQTVYSALKTDGTRQIGEDVISEEAIIIDTTNHTVLGQKDAYTKMSPASMTKILTVLVAAEHVEDLEDTFTIPIEITDYCYSNDCSSVGFSVGEIVPVKDLFYGAILPSGGEAALGLATYVAGSQEAFVELMNQKLTQLGLSDTAHFTNCIGLYDEDHYCTIYDMAIIMEAAVQNEFCKEVLSTHTYTTANTTEHPDGITVSNWFLRRIEDKDTIGTVLCAKTGFVVQSGNCAASYAEDSTGNGYVCATGNATSGWRCIYDHVAIYDDFLSQ